MDRANLIEQINFIEELIPPAQPNRSGRLIEPKMITIHNTSNKSSGADAKNHSKFVTQTGFYTSRNKKTNEEKKILVSWHYTVDDKITIHQLPQNEEAFHAGTKEGNRISIAIEICMHAEINQPAANTRAARLTALLCHDLSIPLDNVVPHKRWTGKNCPELLISSWDNFKQEIAGYFTQLSSADNLIQNSALVETSIKQEDIPLCWNTGSDTTEENVSSENPLSSIQQGFNEKFLAAATTTLPVVSIDNPNLENYIFIHHQNMSIYFNKARKLALYSACNYDKELFISMDRSNTFREDNIGVDTQLDNGFYLSPSIDDGPNSNFFDRGHLIARRYNQWGRTEKEAKKGEKETYYYTTIHPQVKQLNQQEWEDMEDFIISKGRLNVKKVSVIAGAILKEDDPIATFTHKNYKREMKIQIPVVYWKIVYYKVDDELRRIAFLMSQKSQLKNLSMVTFEQKGSRLTDDDPFKNIPESLKTYLVMSSLIEKTCDLTFAAAKELYDKDEPLEVVIEDNDVTHFLDNTDKKNWLSYI